ncbi:hypothetical protein ACFQZS_03560 [Mucilaginibacter calamicampi]|uniref:Uncharacterized protein n=1 Tax=Mucilaginibacter calamicampi TaxID=1302352 RepID=A0ABW2YRZ9_9SPHI
MALFYRLFLAFNSTFLIIIVYLIKESYKLNILASFSRYYSWVLFLLLPVILTAISFWVAKLLATDAINDSSVREIELANNSFLPTYLGYFFVSLGIEDVPTLVVVFLIIYVFTFLSQSLYFNPIFLLFGYQFYFIKTASNIKVFLITRKALKKPGDDGFDNLKRINDYTFIDME